MIGSSRPPAGHRAQRTTPVSAWWLPVMARANRNLIARDLPPLPEKLTQHSLRMTCCSLRLAIGEDLAYVAEQLGHGDTSVTHRYYLRVMRMEPGDRERLRAVVERSLLTAPSGRPAPLGAVV